MTLLRTESFVPLTNAPAPGDAREFRVTIIPPGGGDGAVPPPVSAMPAGAEPVALRARTCEPRVSVQRDGDRITGIRVQCSCGQVLDLACAYESESKA